MNKFITRTKPFTSSRASQKRPAPANSENAENAENVTAAPTVTVGAVEKTLKKAEEPSVMEKLHKAIREEDARFTFDLLSKNRPFDNAMNKTMTKIEFGSSYSESSSEFMLLSVDESVVDAFHAGQSLTIRGDSTDDACLCTDSVTFPIKIIESATTCLLMHQMLEPPVSPTEPCFEVKTVDGKCFATGELCPPVDVLNVGRLKDLLREHELQWNWKDASDEKKENLKGYRLEELLDVVQMSTGELKTALNDLPVIKFPNGKYRFLSHKFRGEMLGLIVEMLDDSDNDDVTFEKMTFGALRGNLPENVPDEAIEWFLTARCDIDSSSTGKFSYADTFFRLPERNLVRDLAVVILYSTERMPFDQFSELLQKILPFGCHVAESVFEGVADISDAPFGRLISYLAPEDLPDTTKERMEYLFERRKLWSMEQLRPYFGDLFKSKVAFDKFVVQNCDYTLSDTNEMLYCGVRM